MVDELQLKFRHLVDKYAVQIGRRYADMMLEDEAAGEMQIAFESLIDSLQESDVQVTDDDRRDLKLLAEALGRATYASGEGLYW